ncbi:lysine transporter LysE [Streptomyces sp. CB00455]|uniref:LysE family transporter n=1 Tax=Streptomyces sp. CB00455 TaxID=1703927 RepID=UPI00094026F9|nr:LysE family transporter [Streptomyces sp. CB00455]OKK17300.1 lysine transporter LysE [Streptomyces sp. CB00455]
MSAALVAGLLAGYGIALPVGAVAAYLVALTARTSLRTGVAAALGVATADGLYALIAVVGGATITPFVQPVTVPLRWASGIVLIVLAVRSAVAALGLRRGGPAQARADAAPPTPARAYVSLLAITVMNPMTVVYFAALVLGSDITATTTRPQQAVFVVAAFAASAGWQLCLAGGGALLGRLLTGSRGRLVTTLASSVLITVMAVHLLLAAPP